MMTNTIHTAVENEGEKWEKIIDVFRINETFKLP